jgi:hypothetical protein
MTFGWPYSSSGQRTSRIRDETVLVFLRGQGRQVVLRFVAGVWRGCSFIHISFFDQYYS